MTNLAILNGKMILRQSHQNRCGKYFILISEMTNWTILHGKMILPVSFPCKGHEILAAALSKHLMLEMSLPPSGERFRQIGLHQTKVISNSYDSYLC